MGKNKTPLLIILGVVIGIGISANFPQVSGQFMNLQAKVMQGNGGGGTMYAEDGW